MHRANGRWYRTRMPYRRLVLPLLLVLSACDPGGGDPLACTTSADCSQPATGCEANVCLAGPG